MAKYTGHTITSDSALGGAKIQRSLRCNYDDSCELRRTFGTNTSNTTKTFSFWMKRSNTSTGSIQNVASTTISGYIEGRLRINTDDTLQFEDRDASGGSSDGRRTTTAKFRDTNSWYHIMLVLDSTQGTELDRAKIYVNGTQDTNFSATRTISEDYSFSFFRSSVVNYMGNMSGSSEFFDGYLAEINFIDGQALDSSYFGFTDPVTGIWMPKRYEGTYGNNGFYLDFSDNTSQATLGIDKSPNGNDFTIENIVAGDSVLDTPSNNFSTLRYFKGPASSGSSLSKGNLKFITGSSGSARNLNRMGMSRFLPTSGKWYAEVRVLDSNGQNFIGVGSYQVEILQTANNTRYAFVYGSDGDKYVRTAGSESIATYAASYTQNDVIGVYVDMDASTPLVSFSKNGQWANGSGSWNQSTPTSYITLGDTFFTEDTGGHLGIGFLVSSGSGGTSATYQFNFGQDSTFLGATTAGGNKDDRGIGDFKYPVPSGALALCSVNLPQNASSIIRPQRHFEPILYTPNSSSLTIDALEFTPNFIWLKSRTQGYRHYFFDSVRGTGQKALSSSMQAAEGDDAGSLTSFNRGGFTFPGSSGFNDNGSGTNGVVALCWKAGGSLNTYNIDDVGYASATAAGLDGGTIDPTGASISTKCGFSITTYSGTGSNATVGHGLGVKPACIICKSASTSSDWRVYHQSLGNTKALKFNTSDQAAASTTYWNDTSPTSTTVSLGTETDLNGSGRTHVMYCWSEIPGYSKFGSYRGNGDSDGTFVYLGFKPALVIFKSTSASENWQMKNSAQLGYNDQNHSLFVNNDNTEYTTSQMDFLSNGFKLRNGGGGSNGSDETLIYMAWAEKPDTTSFDTFPNAR